MKKSGLSHRPSGPARPDRKRREVKAKRGLPDFETVQQCSERQQQMARRFERARELQHDAEWQECERDFCAATPCRDGCWFASRRHRYQMITEGHRLLSNQPGDLFFITITHPKWELAPEKLPEANIPAFLHMAAAASANSRSPAPLNTFPNQGLR
jgi:hypothetical protein